MAQTPRCLLDGGPSTELGDSWWSSRLHSFDGPLFQGRRPLRLRGLADCPRSSLALLHGLPKAQYVPWKSWRSVFRHGWRAAVGPIHLGVRSSHDLPGPRESSLFEKSVPHLGHMHSEPSQTKVSGPLKLITHSGRPKGKPRASCQASWCSLLLSC